MLLPQFQKNGAIVVSVAAAPDGKVLEETRRPSSSSACHMSEECINTLARLEADTDVRNGGPILIEILKCLKSTESKIDLLTMEIKIKKELKRGQPNTRLEENMGQASSMHHLSTTLLQSHQTLLKKKMKMC